MFVGVAPVSEAKTAWRAESQRRWRGVSNGGVAAGGIEDGMAASLGVKASEIRREKCRQLKAGNRKTQLKMAKKQKYGKSRL